ncbi:ABC transporter permease [Mycetocola tolaasinivorans]|uniref:ABC transporter permease n=1 Tax=Mycetocola tolaasinivorans TaxID=76635 RepID=A0A3L6ZZ85_9MICO|nr:ABC transporter permease [Mycetocola tolaasinivorans]RLP72751.1 ABC transporter permease [Mycetocola tolaasinivorans]
MSSLRRSARHIPQALAALVLLLLVIAAVFPGLFAPGDPLAINPADGFQPPNTTHPFGTDGSGRDLYTRVIHGTGPSLLIGLGATALGIGLATVLGFVAGLGPRWLDFGTSRVIEVMLAFPGLVLALLVMVISGPGAFGATVAVGLATAPGYARIIRGRVREIAGSGFVEAARVQGRGRMRILTRHILPGTARSLASLATLGLGQAIVWVCALSFLGLGVAPPAAEWGALLNDGRQFIATFWWLTFFPGLFIVLTAVSATVLGRGLAKTTRSVS